MTVLYYYGERWPSVHHARMRTGCSLLRKDLFYNLHLIEDPHCSCGADLENAKHYFMHCPNYDDIRTSLRQEITECVPFTVKNLLFGNKNFSYEINTLVFKAVHKFIVASKRFH